LALRVLAAVLLALAAFAGRPSESEARMHPYYVVRGVGYHMVKPRILFVLDTSSSMSLRAQTTEAQCAWNKCEGGDGSEQSRIHAARSAIHEVITTTNDAATFGLMTFDKLRSPQGAVPKKCNKYGYQHRFMWAIEYSFLSWEGISQFPGYKGAWRLCDDLNRPYPYLRWDNLGNGSVITDNGETGPLPPSPLISTAEADNNSKYNATRKVQWFPRFLGLRVNLNAQTDPDKEVLGDTIGDWGTTAAELDSEVRGHDFYYWPYVDGYPGYSAFEASPWESPGGDYLGVVQEDNSAAAAQLYGPFYMDLSPSDLNPNYWGPGSHEEAEALVMAHTSPLIEGGVDVSGGTPWGSVIGPIPEAPLKNNAIFSHSTVSSYLKFSTTAEALDVCAPTVAVLITDGGRLEALPAAGEAPHRAQRENLRGRVLPERRPPERDGVCSRGRLRRESVRQPVRRHTGAELGYLQELGRPGGRVRVARELARGAGVGPDDHRRVGARDGRGLGPGKLDPRLRSRQGWEPRAAGRQDPDRRACLH
jgi:hypothetical protein